MKIAVLGSGVVGTTSAWYLAKAGHEVVVIDRQPAPGMETSFANAGEISAGYASPWAAPGVPLKAIKWLFMDHAPLIVRLRPDAVMLRWLASMLRNCTTERYAINKSRMVRLAEFSRDQLIALRQETGILYDARQQGTLQLFRDPRQLDGMAKDAAILEAGGVPFEVLDRSGCVAAEPGLRFCEAQVVGGLRLPNDETGDCFKFTSALAGLMRSLGVSFQQSCTIRQIISDGQCATGVETDTGVVKADAYLVALGSHSPRIIAPLGIKLPVYPVKGYSITAQITDESGAPLSTLLDESYKVAITRLGDRVRVGGLAEIAGFDTRLLEKRRATLRHSVDTLFPIGLDTPNASFWTGLRPMTPDGTPVIGATRYSNLFLNTGHGTLGWTMACGSGHVIADLMSGRSPAIEATDLAIDRFN